MKTLKETKKQELVMQNSIVTVNQGKAIAVIDNETATPVYYCLINSKISKEQAEENAKTVTEHPHDLAEKGRKHDEVKEQRDSCIEALKTISKATGGVINDLEKRLDDIEVIANGAIKSTE